MKLDSKEWYRRSFIWANANENQRKKHIEKHYLKNVIKQDGCWDWKHKSLRREYPGMNFSKSEPIKLVHIFSWEYHKGPIPEGKIVSHTCDNKRCSNPDHLYLGA
jgi:HNH endonuclease